MSSSSFKSTFGGFIKDEVLKTTPKGYPKNHQYIEILRQKSFAVMHHLDKDTIASNHFAGYLKKVYMEMLDFRRYLNNAVSV